MYVNLYSSCVTTKGFLNSSLANLHKGQIYLIDHELLDLLKEGFLDLVSATVSKEKIKYYEDFLIENELGYKSKKKNLINPMELDWDFPAILSNGIIEFEKFDLNRLKFIINQLNTLNCAFLEIRIYNSGFNKSDLKDLNIVINESKVSSYDLFLGGGVRLDQLSNNLNAEKLFNNFTKLSKLVLFESISEKFVNLNGRIFLETKKELKNNLCGHILPQFFSINVSTYSESQKFNSCLNGKVSIDINGEIKNCPSIEKSYGNIKNTKIKDIVLKSDYTKYWKINKDLIETCKVCEFKYVCTDCRAFIEDPTNIYSKPLKCGYNPYLGEWEEWSTNPIKKKVINFYGLE